MSNRAWTWRHAILKSDLPATTRHVLLTISCFMNEMGDGCYPTQKQLSEASGLSERAVRTQLDLAEKAGWIQRKEHGFKGQKWRNHEYVAAWPETQDVDEGAEGDAAPFSEGEERASGKVRNVVPKGAEGGSAYQSIHQSNNQSTPCAQARGEGGGFKILWSGWPEKPDSIEAAQATFNKLSPSEQRQAVEAATDFRRVMALRGKPARLIAYLRNRSFADFIDPPEIDKDGDFVITPQRPEWSQWLGAIRNRYGEAGVQTALKQGRVVRKKRWPDDHQHQKPT